MTFLDSVINNIDTVVKTLSPGTSAAARPNPATTADDSLLSDEQRKHIAGLMRINHTGEVCAQALYQGQAATAKLDAVRASMRHAAEEEIDHLAWCEHRLQELGSQPSILNPAFYALSFGLGAAAGAISDKLSLGFVAATEEQVCKHLEHHLAELPESEHRSRAILEQMLADEGEHASHALNAGGLDFPDEVKHAMTLLSKAMTKTTYRV